MKKQLFGILLFVSCVAPIAAQKAQMAARAEGIEARLRQDITYLASDELGGRRTGERGADLAAAYVAKQFAKAKLRAGGATVNGKPGYLQPFTFTPVRDPHAGGSMDMGPAKEYRGSNVIGVLEGRDPVLKNEVIVIGAHYDHLGRGGSGSLAANSAEIHHGADDNASGTAAIIELARMFGREKRNNRTLVFIAFSGEEEGLFGSKHYVDNPAFPIDKTIAMINLDMVGRLKDNKLTIGGIGTAAEWKSFVEGGQRCPPQSIGLSTCNVFSLQLNEDGFGPSDHSSFYGKKVPVLFFFTGTHNEYHKPTDTADLINYEGERTIIDYIRWIVKAVDARPVRLTYAVAKSSNQGMRTGFGVSLGTIPNYGDSDSGMLLDGVRDGSPAAKAGLKPGDKMTMLAGKPIKNVYDYTAILGEMKADVEYDVVFLRDGKEVAAKITPVKRP